jgi:hypothetical protein
MTAWSFWFFVWDTARKSIVERPENGKISPE